MQHVIATVTGDHVSVRILDQPSLTTVSLDHHNTVVRGDDFVYLDVGRWGGGRTEFRGHVRRTNRKLRCCL
jgi:hypothetical protein